MNDRGVTNWLLGRRMPCLLWSVSTYEWVGIAAVGVTIVIGVLLLVADGAPRKLTFEMMRPRPLISISSDVGAQKLQITFEGRPVTEPHLVRFRFGNNGRYGVRVEHYDSNEPVTFKFEGATALTAEVADSPRTPHPDVTRGPGGAIVFPPTSLNKGEFVLIECVTEGAPKRVLLACGHVFEFAIREMHDGPTPIGTFLQILGRLLVGGLMLGGGLMFAWGLFDGLRTAGWRAIVGVLVFLIAVLVVAHLIATVASWRRLPDRWR
jgi:hypothetical protein